MFENNNKKISHDSSSLSRTGCNKQKRWYAVYTKARQEQLALDHLQRQGYEVYLPRWEVTKRKKSLLRSQVEPFFPRYLFIHLDQSADNWAPIKSTRGVSCLIQFGGKPKPVPDALVNLLQQNENSQHLQKVRVRGWERGEEVEVEEGAFAGYRCIFLEGRSMDRVRVLLEVMGTQTQATLSRNNLAAPTAVSA